MKFAVLTRSKADFAAVVDCFDPDGATCRAFSCATAFLRAARCEHFDLTLIHATLFGSDGDNLLSWRDCHADHRLPIIVYGQFADRASMLRAFDADVSDVLVGALDINELYVRTQRVLTSQRHRPAAPAALAVGEFRLCQKEGVLTRRGQQIYLTSREFAMAWLFFSNPGTYFSKRQLAARIWGDTVEFRERTIEQHVYKLRKKLEIGKHGAVRLDTSYGLGYKLEIGEGAAPAPRAPAAAVAAGMPAMPASPASPASKSSPASPAPLASPAAANRQAAMT